MSDKTKRVSIDVSVNADSANRALTDLSQRLTDISKKSINISLNINKGQYTSQINQINNSIKQLSSNINKNLSNIKVGIDTTEAEADINRFTANLTGTFGKIGNSSDQISDKMIKSFNEGFNSILGSADSFLAKFANSFKGINNIVGNIKKVANSIKNEFGKLAGANTGYAFVDKFIKSTKGIGKVLGNAVSNVGQMAKAGLKAGASFAKAFIRATKNISKFINDALKKDYTVDLQQKGMKGLKANYKIDTSGMEKELKAVSKKIASDLLGFSKEVKTTSKVLSQAFTYLKKNSEKLADAFENATSKMRDSKNPAVSLLGSTAKALAGILAPIITSLKIINDILKPMATSLSSVLKVLLSLINVLGRALDMLLKVVRLGIQPTLELQNKIAEIGSEGRDSISKAFDGIANSLRKGNDAIESFTDGVKTTLGRLLKMKDSTAPSGKGSKVGNALSNIFNTAKAGASFVTGLARNIGSKLTPFINVGKKIGKSISNGIKAVAGIFKGVIRFISKFILGPIGLVINIGKAIGRAIFKGITAIFNVLKIGVNIIKSIVKGIMGALSLVVKAGRLIANAIIKGVKAVGALIKLGATIAKNIITGITRVVKSFVNIGLTIGRAIVKGVTTAVRFVGAFAKTFVNLGINITKAIARGIKSGLGFVINAIKGLTKAIMTPIKLMGRTISSTIGTAFSISRSLLGGIGNTIMEALDGDHTIELELVPSTGNILDSLIDKRDVSNQLKRDLSVITQTMPKELGQVTNAFGARIIDAGVKVQRYANLLLQAYDFVRNNKTVITNTFQKLYNVMAPVAKRIMSDLGVVLRDYGQKAFTALKDKLVEKVSPIVEPFQKVIKTIIDEFNRVKENLSGIGGQLKDVITNFKARIGDIAGNLKIIFGELAASFGDISTVIKGKFVDIVSNFSAVVAASIAAFKEIIGNFGGVTEIVKAVLNDAASLFKQLAPIIKAKFMEILGDVSGRLAQVIETIKQKLPAILEALGQFLVVVIQNLRVALDKVIELFNRFKPILSSAIDKIKEFVSSISAEDIKKSFTNFRNSLTKLVSKLKTFMEVLAVVATTLMVVFHPVTAPLLALVAAAYALVKIFQFLHTVLGKFATFVSNGFRGIFGRIKDYWDKKTGNYDYTGKKADIEKRSDYEFKDTRDRVKDAISMWDYKSNMGNSTAINLATAHNTKRLEYKEQEEKLSVAINEGKKTDKIRNKLKEIDLSLLEIDSELIKYLDEDKKHILGVKKELSMEGSIGNESTDDITKSIEEARKAAEGFGDVKDKSFNLDEIKKSFDKLCETIKDTGEETEKTAKKTEQFSVAASTLSGESSETSKNFQTTSKVVQDFANKTKESFNNFAESLGDIFDTEPVKEMGDAVKDMFTGEEATEFKDTIVNALDSEAIERIKESFTSAFDNEATDKIRESITDALDNELTNAVKNRVIEGAEAARKALTTESSPERVEQAKANLKATGSGLVQRVRVEADTTLLKQKLDSTFQSMRHPVNALKEDIKAKLGKVHINLTVKGEQQARKAVNDVAKALEKFKSAKGSEKITAGLDVAIQSIKYKLITLKNTMKENFVSNLIDKMSGKAKKASKELAENVPGGSKTIGFFKSSLGKLSLLLGGFGIGAYIKQATDLAIKYEASAMQIQRSLGTASQKIMDFANTSAAALGISQTQTMEYGNRFSLMVRQFLTDTDDIANTTNALLQSAAIVASGTGTELSTVMDAFQSALTGSSEAVDQYGLNMKIANLEARLGIDNWNDLTTAQQQFYITQELINQTTANFGSKTLKNTNSMLAQFKAQLSNTSLALGKAFKALLTVVLPYLTAFLKVLEKVFNYISTMITSLLSLFGITVDFTSNVGDIEAVGSDVDTTGLDGVSDGMDNVADGAEGAKDKIEKMKGSLAGFDELNTLSFTDNSDSGSDSSDIPVGDMDLGDLGEGMADLSESEGVFNVLQDKLEGFKEWFDKLIERAKELASLFKEGFDLSFDASKLQDIWESLKSIGESLKYIFFNEEVAAALNNLANKFAFAAGQIVGAIANIAATIVQTLLGGIAQSLDENKDWIKEKLITCIDVTAEIWELLGNFAQAISEIFGVLGEEEGKGIIANIVSGLTYAFGTHMEIMLKLGRDIVDLITGPIVDNVDAIKENFKSFLGTIETITGTIKDAIKAVCDTISETYDEKISPTLKLLRDGFSDTMAKLQEVYAEYIQPVLDAMAERFDEVMDKYITPALQNLVSLFGTLIEVLGVLYETVLKPLIDFIIQVIVPVAMPILEAAWNTIVTVVGVVIGVIGDLLGVLDGFLTFLVGVFQGDWEKAWGGLQKCSENFFKIFTDIWDGIKSLFENGEKYLESFKNFFKGMVDYIKGRMEYFKEKIGENAEKAWEAIKKPFELMGQWFKDTFTKALDLIKDAWSGIKTWATEKYEDFTSAFSNFGTWCKDTWENAYTKATEAWSNIKTWASGLVTSISDGLSNLSSSMSSKFSDAWTACKDAFKGVATWASGLAETIVEKFKNLGSTVGEAIGGAVKAAINGVISTIENVINGAIGLINGAIKLINKIPGVSISTLNDISLPRLANGAYVTSSTLANIGEAGPEAVIPLNRSNLWAPQLASELARQLSVSGINQSNTSSRPLEVKLVVDGRELGRASINNINKLQRESNEILLDI